MSANLKRAIHDLAEHIAPPIKIRARLCGP